MALSANTCNRGLRRLSLCLVICSSAFAQPQSPAETRAYEELWIGHASYQINQRMDYVTPVLVRAVLNEARQNPNADYNGLIKKALDVRTNYQNSLQYAQTGHLPDPFVQEQAFVHWAQGVTDVAQLPFAKTLVQAADLSIQLVAGLTDHLTSIDDSQQVELQSLLYRSSFQHIDTILKDAQQQSKNNPRLRSAVNTLLSAVNVQLGDSLEDISHKSPAIVAQIDTTKLAKAVESEKVDSEILKAQLSLLMAQTKDSFEQAKTLRSALDKITNVQDEEQQRKVLLAQIEATRQRERQQIEASRAVLSILTSAIGVNKPEEARKIQTVGDSLIRVWEAGQRYNDFIATQQGGHYAEVILMGDWIQAGFALANAFSPQEDPTALILEQINQLKHMISDLYEMTSKRFDRLELIMATYQHINMEAFRTLIVQVDLTLSQLDSVRQALGTVIERLDAIPQTIDANTRGIYLTRFADLSRRCLSNDLSPASTFPLDKRAFDGCVLNFQNIALDVSRVPPFTDVPGYRVAPDQVSVYLTNPFERLVFLSTTAHKLVGAERPARDTISNPVVWSNGTRALLSMIQARPQLGRAVGAQTLTSLEKRGEDIRLAIRSIFAATDGHADQRLFETLLARWKQSVLGLGVAVNSVAEDYSARNSDGVNPFKYTLRKEDDSKFERLLPPRIQKCADNDTEGLPDSINVPPGVAARLDASMKLANRIDQAGHQIGLCYGVFFADPRVYRSSGEINNQTYYRYFVQPVFKIFVTMKDAEVGPLQLFVSLPDAIIGFTPVNEPAPDHAKYRFVGDYTYANPPASLRSFERRWPFAFQDWIDKGGLGTFSEKAQRGWAFDGKVLVETISKTGGMSRTFPALDHFVSGRMEDNRRAIEDKIIQEFADATSGPLRNALREYSGTKRLLDAYTTLAFPESLRWNVALQRSVARDFHVLDDSLEWQTATSVFDDSTQLTQVPWWEQNWSYPEQRERTKTPKASEVRRWAVEELAVTGAIGDVSQAFTRRFDETSLTVLRVSSSQLLQEEDPSIFVTLGLLRSAKKDLSARDGRPSTGYQNSKQP